MRVVYEYSHLGGAEILKVRYPQYEREIYEVIAEVAAERSKQSLEKNKAGRMLYAPIEMNRQFSQAFAARGYHELRDTTQSRFRTATLPFRVLSSKWITSRTRC